MTILADIVIWGAVLVFGWVVLSGKGYGGK